MKEVVWVFGSSAAGKETFIATVRQNKRVLARLGWLHKSVATCEESVRYIALSKDDPAIVLRDTILQRVPELIKTNDVVLIKWQIIDSQACRPQKLRAELPQVRHKILELRLPQVEHVTRLAQKSWWHQYGHEEETLKAEAELIAKYIDELKDSFDLTILRSGKNEGYRYHQDGDKTS